MLWLRVGVAAGPLLLSRALLLPLSRAVLFQPSSVGNLLPDLDALNSTLGHSTALWALGLGLAEEASEPSPTPRPVGEDDDDGDEDFESGQLISRDELTETLEAAKRMTGLSPEDIAREGWHVIHSSPLISLLKRRLKVRDRSPGPVEYLMLGRVADVSPRTFLLAQISKRSRARWDRTMKTMETPGDVEGSAETLMEGSWRSLDRLYYRTRWPWPLKDRDYTLVRRCRVFAKDHAIVLVSRSSELSGFPAVEGVIRVDNYRCHSTIISDPREGPASVDTPGLRYVTIFCDDQRVPLPASIVDLISAQGEKVVPGAIQRLHEVAREMERPGTGS